MTHKKQLFRNIVQNIMTFFFLISMEGFTNILCLKIDFQTNHFQVTTVCAWLKLVTIRETKIQRKHFFQRKKNNY
jgi:hypothetical protein